MWATVTKATLGSPAATAIWWASRPLPPRRPPRPRPPPLQGTGPRTDTSAYPSSHASKRVTVRGRRIGSWSRAVLSRTRVRQVVDELAVGSRSWRFDDTRWQDACRARTEVLRGQPGDNGGGHSAGHRPAFRGEPDGVNPGTLEPAGR